jgi:DNA-binding transcriptional MerR regulator
MESEMNKQGNFSKTKRIIDYVNLKHFLRTTTIPEVVFAGWIEQGIIEVAKIAENGDRLFDKEVCYKRIKNYRKLRNKSYPLDVSKAN